MRTTICGTLVLVALVGMTSAACDSAVKAPSSGVQRSALSQDLQIGTLRAEVTKTLLDWKAKKVCWEENTISKILNSAETVAIFEDRKIEWTDNDVFPEVLAAFKDSETLTSVLVTHTVDSATFEYLIVPDAAASGGIYTIEIGPEPQQDWTCVECTEYVGNVESGPNCKCETTINVVCGDNPTVSCTSECTFCPNGGVDSSFDRATALCGTSVPFVDDTGYPTLIPGDSLNP